MRVRGGDWAFDPSAVAHDSGEYGLVATGGKGVVGQVEEGGTGAGDEGGESEPGGQGQRPGAQGLRTADLLFERINKEHVIYCKAIGFAFDSGVDVETVYVRLGKALVAF